MGRGGSLVVRSCRPSDGVSDPLDYVCGVSQTPDRLVTGDGDLWGGETYRLDGTQRTWGYQTPSRTDVDGGGGPWGEGTGYPDDTGRTRGDPGF